MKRLIVVVVVILVAVCMGYLVGRKSVPPSKTAPAVKRTAVRALVSREADQRSVTEKQLNDLGLTLNNAVSIKVRK